MFRKSHGFPSKKATYAFDRRENRHENVRVVVGSLVLDHRHQTLESHAGVNVLLRQRRQGSIRFTAKFFWKKCIRFKTEEIKNMLFKMRFNEKSHRLNWMNTRFQISSTSGSSRLTSAEASRFPIRSKWISEHGPHGPVSPISQKFSFIGKGKTRCGAKLKKAEPFAKISTVKLTTINQSINQSIDTWVSQSINQLIEAWPLQELCVFRKNAPYFTTEFSF